MDSDNNCDYELIPNILRLNTTDDLQMAEANIGNQQIAVNTSLVGNKRTLGGCTLKSRPHFNVESQLRR